MYFYKLKWCVWFYDGLIYATYIYIYLGLLDWWYTKSRSKERHGKNLKEHMKRAINCQLHALEQSSTIWPFERSKTHGSTNMLVTWSSRTILKELASRQSLWNKTMVNINQLNINRCNRLTGRKTSVARGSQVSTYLTTPMGSDFKGAL